MDYESISQLTEHFLLWVGFGTVVGLLAKMIMPGRDPGGSIATLLMGIVGTLIGCGLVQLFNPNVFIRPISPAGLGVGVAGAFIILAFYRLLAGYFFVEGEYETIRTRRRRRSRQRYAYYD